MVKFCQSKALQFNIIKGACLASTFLSAVLFAAPKQLQSYQAQYDILRKGERLGSAYRKLIVSNNTCELSYKSDLKWMIFTDKRSELASFYCDDQHVKPNTYVMRRSGTGPDKDYSLAFDHSKKQVQSNLSKYPLSIKFKEDFQDAISYQVQMRLDLKAGKNVFDYPIVDKKGRSRNYKFEIIGEETISVPYGNIKTIKAKRLYDNDKRQAFAWFAPEMDFLLVRMWKGEKGVEQLDAQLKTYEQ
jgi:hypothetical protein